MRVAILAAGLLTLQSAASAHTIPEEAPRIAKVAAGALAMSAAEMCGYKVDHNAVKTYMFGDSNTNPTADEMGIMFLIGMAQKTPDGRAPFGCDASKAAAENEGWVIE